MNRIDVKCSRPFPGVPVKRTLCLAVLCLAGCGGGKEEAKSPASSAAKTEQSASPQSAAGKAAKTAPEPEGYGSAVGVIRLTGSAPELKLLVEKGAEVRDANICSVNAIPDESLVVNSENQGVANVFIFLSRAPRAGKSESPSKPAVIDQKGCRFVPHTVLAQSGQGLQAISSDAVPHNIHTFPLRNSSVNSIVRPNDQTGITLDLTRPESQPFQVKCDIHPWMSAYVLALDHSFMAVTDENGSFKIEGLPVGTHQLKVWHEKAGFLEKEYEVSIEKDAPTEVNLEYGADKFAVKEILGLKTVVVSSIR